MADSYQSVCGCFYVTSPPNSYPQKKYIPQIDLSSHTTILSTTSRTILTQTFLNPSKIDNLDQVQYIFPLYDGVSVVGFKCTVAGRVIVGVVKEKQQARKDYKEAVDRGETAGLLEQFSRVADCFSTRVGNVPADEKVIVEITYLGELKHDAETDGVRFTIPTVIAPRYGSIGEDFVGPLHNASSARDKEGIRILVDIAVEDGVTIRAVQSPSHPIAMTMGRTSSMPEEAFDNQHASATLTFGKTELDKDFIIVITSKGHDTPRALLETHPTIPNHRALMATLVPRFSLLPIHPEIVFVADRSGSMGGKIHVLVSALKIFLKSLPVGVKFNICSFGTQHTFLWPKSRTYDESSLTTALTHVESFDASFGGTEMLAPIKGAVRNRYKDMHLEVIVATDGQIWNQEELFGFINEAATETVRFFSLGIGHGASSSLVEGIARAGGGFAQFVGEKEKMEKRVVRMLKGALTPHIKDYRMEVKYENADEEFEILESVTESLKGLDTDSEKPASEMKKEVISLFDKSAKVDDTIDKGAGRHDHLPPISTPKLLQTPHKIPALYPFNRTSVYLLMSAESCQRKPKAIVLHATSEHGPLELVIPVQDVGTGETLHQLAAKKTIQELEEERGWITEATCTDGKLLKAKFEGRWDEMVEREAVRLGVQFQVANKWCSFIAIEKNANKSEDLPDYEMIDNEELGDYGRKTAFAQNTYAGPTPAQSQNVLSSSAMLTCGSPSQTAYSRPRKSCSQSMRLMTQSHQAASAAPPAPPACDQIAFSTYYDPTIEAEDDTSTPQYEYPPVTRAVDSASFKLTSPGQSATAAEPASARKRMAGKKRTSAGDVDSRQRDMSVPASDIKAAPLPRTNEDRLHELISLQTFDGSWKWTDTLFAVLELEDKLIKATLPGLEETTMATLLAVAFLEGKMSEEEGVWEMVVEKAKGWLEGKVGKSRYTGDLAKIKKEILGVA